MTKKEIRKIANDVTRIMMKSKPVFFVKDEKQNKALDEIFTLADELLYEQKATMVTDVEMYFSELLHPTLTNRKEYHEKNTNYI